MRLKGIISKMYLAGLVLAGVLTGGCTRLEMLDYVSNGND